MVLAEKQLRWRINFVQRKENTKYASSTTKLTGILTCIPAPFLNINPPKNVESDSPLFGLDVCMLPANRLLARTKLLTADGYPVLLWK
jgi:hypothetical protein